MSEKDEIKQTPETSEEASDTAEALKEYAEEEAAAAENGDADTKKKKKHQRTPEEEKERALNRVKRRKKFKYGTLSTIITLVVIAIVVVINVICGLLDNRFNWNIDLTSSGLYQIDDQTVEYLHQLNSDVKITVLADESYFLENSTLKVAAETLTRFKTESNGHITVDYIDPNKNPETVSVYKQNYNGELSVADVIVSCGELVRVIPFNDIIRQNQDFDYNTYSYNTTMTFVGEQSLISAIMGVTDLHPVKIGMIDKTGGQAIYDQRDSGSYQAMQTLLEKNNFEYESIDIATAELSADYDMLILCSPANDITEAQAEKLTNYLNNDNKYGKKLVYFGSAFKSADTKNLDNFLALWGLKFGHSYVAEKNESAAQVAAIALSRGMAVGEIPVVTANANAELNGKYTASKLPIIAPLCCPIERLFEQNSGRNTSALLTTSDTCVEYPLDETAESFDADKAGRKSFEIAAVSESTFTSGSDTLVSQVIAFGSSYFLDYYIASSAGNYDNANYFITVLNSATGKENVLTIAEKSLDAKKIAITDAQTKAIRNVTVLVIPLAVALLGIFVYVRRRNK